MNCIYLNCVNGKCHCHAQPLREHETVHWYKPTEDEIKDYCKNPKSACPRFEAFQDHLRIQSSS